MSILDILKKKPEFISGLYLEENEHYQMIELQRINSSFFPVYTSNSFIENFISPHGVFYKENFIEKIKKEKAYLKNNKIKINSLKNKKLEKEIVLALKIIGFEVVEIINKKNIEGVILTETPLEEMFVHFNKLKITIYLIENGLIKEKKYLEASDLSIGKIHRLTKNLEQKHIFLSGVSQRLLKPTINLFYQAGIKVHLKNIWENFLDFKDGIPNIFIEDGYKYINVLSITIPNLKKWKEIPKKETISEEKSPKKEEGKINKKKTEKWFLPKRKKLFLPKPRKKMVEKNRGKNEKKEKVYKKNFLAQSFQIKNNKKSEEKKISLLKFKQSIKKISKKKNNGLKKERDKKMKKWFLPKRKKLFLPKPRKKIDRKNYWKRIKKFLKAKI